MKRVLALTLCSLFVMSSTYGKSKSEIQPFEEAYKKQIQDLLAKKDKAISAEEFYNEYIFGKSKLQISAQVEEWNKSGQWPIISFNFKVNSVENSKFGPKLVKENKDKFAYLYLVDYITLSNSDSVSLWVYGNILKTEALNIDIDTYFEGFGILNSFGEIGYISDSFGMTLYPIVSAYYIPDGQGTKTFPDGEIYVGYWKDSMMNGQGTMTYPDGSKYIGNWKDNQKHGNGTYTDSEGNKYTGEWKEDMKDGQGTMTFDDGSQYVGQWKEDKQNGQGTMTFDNVAKYVGQWKDDMRHGYGKMTYDDGSKYDGQWKDDKQHGQGTSFNSDGSIDQKGYFEEDEYIGETKSEIENQ